MTDKPLLCAQSQTAENQSLERIPLIPLDQLPDSTLLDPKPAARYLDVKEDTLAVWRATKRYPLRYVKIGKRVKYKAGDIKAFIESRTVAQ
jgi:hypothetical protein